MGYRYHVFILASKRNGALFVGITDELALTVLDHKCNLVDGLTSRYAIHRLVYVEGFATRGQALLRERALQALPRAARLALIENANPGWRDLYDDLPVQRRRRSALAG